jgi:hypothetical protein
MKNNKAKLLLTTLVSFICMIANAEQAPTGGNDKSRYSLFDPTPESEMRDFATDRPDKTESPYSVDAGHFQFETDIANYSKDTVGGEKTETLNINFINLKMGLTNRTDLQVVFGNYVRQTTSTGGTLSGLGDLSIRYKINLYGNDQGDFAIGLMPFATLPTATNGLGSGSVEGGLLVPFALDLPADFSSGGMFQINMAKDEIGNRYHPELIGSVTAGHSIVGELSSYVEFFAQQSTETGAPLAATFDIGFTYMLVPNWQLDFGVNLGVTDAADDVNPFLGLSARF